MYVWLCSPGGQFNTLMPFVGGQCIAAPGESIVVTIYTVILWLVQCRSFLPSNALLGLWGSSHKECNPLVRRQRDADRAAGLIGHSSSAKAQEVQGLL